MLPSTDGTIRFSNQMPPVAASMPMVFAETCWNTYKLTAPLTPSSVSAREGTTAIIQKKSAARQKPCTGGTSTFNHRSKNKYCAVNTDTLRMESAKTRILLLVDTLFISLPYSANLRRYLFCAM